MMIEQAQVLSYQNGKALVQCQAKQGCGSCSAKDSCGTKSLSGLAGEKFAPQFEVNVAQQLNAGDFIEIGLTERSLLFSAFLLYVIPLFTIIISALLFSQFLDNELLVTAAILGCTATTFILIKRIIAKQNQAQFVPVFLRKI
ncbi:transcriptional regulator [Pasteurellaceae bacterium LFhippo2]|nr:transcriptional regulator [Pasteurellaceae bacterium LFhippo2]